MAWALHLFGLAFLYFALALLPAFGPAFGILGPILKVAIGGLAGVFYEALPGYRRRKAASRFPI